MAVKMDSLPYKAEDAEVASCVSNLVQAFTNGLNIFKRLRERRRKRKARNEKQSPDPTTSAELQLSKSLRKGPQELAERYAECYHSGMGQQFAKGDAIAHASLAETLIKLNTGLVGIIAAFLNHDHKSGKSYLNLDYKSLTNLSDSSRREALQSMTQLYQRLSHSQLQLYSVGASSCARCGSAKHVDCSGRSTSPEKERRRHTSSRQRINGPIVTKMPIKSSNQPQLVVMRPKNTRKGSSSSNSSSSMKSGSNSGSSTPLASPLPKYVPVEPVEFQTSGVIQGTMGGWPESGKPRKDSFHDSISQQVYTPVTPDRIHHPTPKLPNFTPTPRRQSPQHQKTSPPPPSSSPPIKRRLDKATPSSYTFASDSTKLGEIPQRNWTQPWDYEEAERLNAEAAVIGHASAAVVGDKVSKKKGLFGFLRRGSAAGQTA
ncbi:Nn.00g049840.m01.CDS01 [Neocucurbitaria sp. VM-36]